MISAKRRQWLHDQVYLTLVNDGELYRAVSDAVARRDLNSFRHRANARRTTLCSNENHTMTGEERRFVNLLLWQNWADEIRVEDIRRLSEYEATWLLHWPKTEQPSQSEENTMNPTTATFTPALAFETKHFVFGTDVSQMSEGQLISAVKQLEAEIADLKAVKTKSTRIAAKVKDLEGMLAKVVEVLDAK